VRFLAALFLLCFFLYSTDFFVCFMLFAFCLKFRYIREPLKRRKTRRATKLNETEINVLVCIWNALHVI